MAERGRERGRDGHGRPPRVAAEPGTGGLGARAEAYLWDPSVEPDAELLRLEAALRPLQYREIPASTEQTSLRRAANGRSRSGRRAAWLPLATTAGLLAAAASAAVYVQPYLHTAPGWRVAPLAGTPALRALGSAPAPAGRASRLGLGGEVETDARSAARIAIGRIGTVDVGPNSRVRLVRAAGTEHRLALAQGVLHARVWAPPRFFLVETPAALAVDLGCAYALRVDPDGGGVLTVTSGEVELVRGGRQSLVVAGSAAAMRPGSGPGTPYPVGSSPAFQSALATLDFGTEVLAPGADGGLGARDAALAVVLREARGHATITLWHLLPRVRMSERVRLYDRLAALAPPPAGVTRAGVLGLDARMLARWQAALAPTWSDEPVPAWQRLWRRAWALAGRR